MEKGSSSWSAALPFESHGFAPHMSAFRDALCLRYGWQPERLPTRVTVVMPLLSAMHSIVKRCFSNNKA